MPNLEDLPPELQLRIMRHMVADEADKIRITSARYKSAMFNSRYPFSFTSPGCATFSNIKTIHNGSAAINYRDAVLERLIKSDGDVYATVKDLQFNNLQKFVKCLQAKNKLHPFLKQGGRDIIVQHAVTNDFPIETARLHRWAKFAQSFTNEQAGEELAPYHVVRQHDTNANDRIMTFLRAANYSHDGLGKYGQFSDALDTFYAYIGERLRRGFEEAVNAGLSEEQQDELDLDMEYMQANAEEYPDLFGH